MPRAGRWVFLVPLAFLLLFFAYPLATVLVTAFDGLAAWQWATGPYVGERLGVALLQAVLSVAATFVLAVPLAWHHHRRRIPWSRVHLAVHAAPFVLPVFVVVNGLRELAGPGGWTEAAVGVDVLGWLGPVGTVVVAHAYYNYGFAARLLHTTLERRPHRLEAAAATLGAPPRAAFLRTTGRLLAPAILSIALLVFLFTFTSFGVVLLLGDGAVSTLETLIYQNLGGIFPRHERAAVLGVVQLALNAIVIGAYFALHRRQTPLPREPPRARLPARRRDRAIALGALMLGLLPAVAVLVGGFRIRGEWTLEAWRALLDTRHPAHQAGFELGPVIVRSLGYAVTSAALAVLLTLALGYGLRRTGRLRPVAEAFATLPLGTSSVLLGFAYLVSFGANDLIDLRGQAAAIPIVHALIGFPFVARIFLPALDQHEGRLDEAAAVLGARPRDILLRIHGPLLRAPLVAAAGFAAAMSLGDFGASLILMRRDTMSLSVWISEHEAPFRLVAHAQSVALTAVLMVLVALAYLIVERFGRWGDIR